MMEFSRPESLSQVLKDPQMRGAFRSFCEDKLAGENFLFWEDCEGFQKIENEEERRVRFNQIYEKFLSVESDTEMNISGEQSGARITVGKVLGISLNYFQFIPHLFLQKLDYIRTVVVAGNGESVREAFSVLIRLLRDHPSSARDPFLHGYRSPASSFPGGAPSSPTYSSYGQQSHVPMSGYGMPQSPSPSPAFFSEGPTQTVTLSIPSRSQYLLSLQTLSTESSFVFTPPSISDLLARSSAREVKPSTRSVTCLAAGSTSPLPRMAHLFEL